MDWIEENKGYVIIPTENIIISHVNHDGEDVQLFKLIMLEQFGKLYQAKKDGRLHDYSIIKQKVLDPILVQ